MMNLKLLPLVLLALTTMVLAGGYSPRFSDLLPEELSIYSPEQPSFLGQCPIDSNNLMYRTADERCGNGDVLIYVQCVPHIDPNTQNTYGMWEERSLVCSAQKAGYSCYDNRCGEGNRFTGIYYYLVPLVVLALVATIGYYLYRRYKKK